MTNPDPSRFFDTRDLGLLLDITDNGIRKILRPKRNGETPLLSHQFIINKQKRYFVEKWLAKMFIQNEITRHQKDIQYLTESLVDPDRKIREEKAKRVRR
jgi:hypothetical protein